MMIDVERRLKHEFQIGADNFSLGTNYNLLTSNDRGEKLLTIQLYRLGSIKRARKDYLGTQITEQLQRTGETSQIRLLTSLSALVCRATLVRFP